MDEFAVLFLAINAIEAVSWLITSLSWWLTIVAELAILAGAVLTVIADLLTAWWASWASWAIVAESAVVTGAVGTSVTLTGTTAAG